MATVQSLLDVLWMFRTLFKLPLSLARCPGIGIVRYLVFEGTSVLFSTVVAPAYIPTDSIGGLPFLHTLSSIYSL